jgi:hypothetical protein
MIAKIGGLELDEKLNPKKIDPHSEWLLKMYLINLTLKSRTVFFHFFFYFFFFCKLLILVVHAFAHLHTVLMYKR